MLPPWFVGGRTRGGSCPAPGSVGAIGWRCNPHCWQYAKPIGVAVPQRGQVIMLLGTDGWLARPTAGGGARLPDGRDAGVAGVAGAGVKPLGAGVKPLGAGEKPPGAVEPISGGVLVGGTPPYGGNAPIPGAP
jgi:hypothetical protein